MIFQVYLLSDRILSVKLQLCQLFAGNTNMVYSIIRSKAVFYQVIVDDVTVMSFGVVFIAGKFNGGNLSYSKITNSTNRYHVVWVTP